MPSSLRNLDRKSQTERSYDPFAIPAKSVEFEQAQEAYSEFEKIVNGEFAAELKKEPPAPEKLWLRACREAVIRELGYVSDPEFIARTQSLLLTLDPLVEVELQTTPVLNKLVQWGENADQLGKLISAVNRYKCALELDYKLWRANNEKECQLKALQMQSENILAVSGKQAPPSALSISTGATENQRMLNYQTTVEYFEIRLIYLDSVLKHLDGQNGTKDLIVKMSGTTSAVAKILANIGM